jgi:hypothetical protein
VKDKIGKLKLEERKRITNRNYKISLNESNEKINLPFKTQEYVR